MPRRGPRPASRPAAAPGRRRRRRPRLAGRRRADRLPVPDRAARPDRRPLFDFDDAGDWLLAAGPLGLLHAWRVDGTGRRSPPGDGRRRAAHRRSRPCVGGRRRVRRGRPGGRTRVAAHYDFAGRTLTRHRSNCAAGDRIASGPTPQVSRGRGAEPGLVRSWCDRPGRRSAPACFRPDPPDASASHRAKLAGLDGPRCSRRRPGDPRRRGADARQGRALRLAPETGTLDIQNDAGPGRRIRPMADGRPALKGGRSSRPAPAAMSSASSSRRSRTARLFLFSASDSGGSARSRSATTSGVRDLARRPSVRAADRRPAPGDPQRLGGHLAPVRHAQGEGPPPARRRDRRLGSCVQAGKHVHLIDWERGPLRFTRSPGGTGWLIDQVFPGRTSARSADRPDRLTYDNRRFVAAGTAHGLRVIVDAASQVAVLDARSGVLVCMFYVFRDQVAAWMPGRDAGRAGPDHRRPGRPRTGWSGSAGAPRGGREARREQVVKVAFQLRTPPRPGPALALLLPTRDAAALLGPARGWASTRRGASSTSRGASC